MYIHGAAEKCRTSVVVASAVVLVLAIGSCAQGKAVSSSAPDDGSVLRNTYRNSFFRLTYVFPEGWVVLNQASQTEIRLSPKAPLYTLLFVTEEPTNGVMSPSNAGVVLLAEDISNTTIRDGKSAVEKLTTLLTHTDPKHKVLSSPRQLQLGSEHFYRVNYSQQTFENVRHYFCSVVGVVDGYALRWSVIADSEPDMQQVCKTVESAVVTARSSSDQ